MKTILMVLLLGINLLMSNLLVSTVSANELDEILTSPHRSDENKSRDEARHPKETIEFFGTKPTDHVLEMWPGDGWYSEILAPYVKDKGHFSAVTFSTGNLNSSNKRDVSWSRNALSYKEKMSDVALYGKVDFFEFEPPKSFDLKDIKPVDVVYVIRNLHVWDEYGALNHAIQAIYTVLKPNGILAVVQHRGDAVSKNASSAAEGYLDERYVIEAIEKNGFELVSSSEINLNLNDTKDYPKGVYALPPVLAMGGTERDKYIGIGESDRMTLKFIKTVD
ncbi:methyltransferase [uncultured Psychrosphaera sp.]|jgi:predicted methyltransferase|uniref:class I SAM-dependent methyltransferase n=1 Tax=uncultured Psychrosphaera sp. TaxID=1403522 RepID=UPI00261FBA45|nr:methyltransferase [uncultured Psychrosphaera sp.]